MKYTIAIMALFWAIAPVNAGTVSLAGATVENPAPAVRSDVAEWANSSSLAELDEAPGIGPVLAGRIAAHRAETPFTTNNSLMLVKGIGVKTLEKIEAWIINRKETTK